jgi:hypothetical protein
MANQAAIIEIERLFSDRYVSDQAIDLTKRLPISLTIVKSNPELNHFFGLDEDGPYSEIIKKGFLSFRKGLYKIITRPHYRTDISPGTFAADVLYLDLSNNQFIKYHANIGPITNGLMIYRSRNRNFNGLYEIPMVGDFARERDKDNFRTHYHTSKERFYNRIFDQQKIIYIEEAIWAPPNRYSKVDSEEELALNKMKKTTWCFIDI